jgi:sphingomyelin phosphodiesterase acid-like 3
MFVGDSIAMGRTKARFGCGNCKLPAWGFILALLFTLLFSPSVAQGASTPTSNRFLIVSDIHFNPMADASLVAQLEAADPAQWAKILARSQPTAFSQYGQDTNWWLLQSALNQMRVTIPHPAFIIVNGDSLAHQFPQTFRSITHDEDREHYRRFVQRTVQFLALQLRQRYPTAKVFMTPGNNDEECGNYSIAADGLFLHDTASLVRELAHGDDEMRASWESLGSYDVPHPTLRGVRILSLNTVFFSQKYHATSFNENCAAVDSKGPSEAFAWLESRLSHAKAVNEKVWLIFHIPPGIDGFSSVQQYQSSNKRPSAADKAPLCAASIVPMWVPEWTARFDALLERYQSTVIVALAGHTHTDDFRVIDPAAVDSNYILISPAISPVYNQNPAFRTATYAKDGSLLDASVYYLTNLIFASSTTPGEWQLEYTFSKQWKVSRIDAASLKALYSRIQSDKSVRDDWLRLYNTSSSAAYLTAGSAPGLTCAVEGLDSQDYGKCYCSGEATVPDVAQP